MKKVVLLLNMGGARSKPELKTFLKNMFNDKYILRIKNDKIRAILAWIIVNSRIKNSANNYASFGGSPIHEITQKLVDKLRLKEKEFEFDFIMNYTEPFAKDVLNKYKNFDEIILFPLYPHFSTTTIKSSVEDVLNAAKSLNITNKIKTVKPFYKNDLYNEILIKNINKAALENKNADLIFSAHSLPVSTIKAGDPYEKQINEHVEILKEKLDLSQFREVKLAYQSKLGPVKWLGPSIGEILKQSKESLIYPISFCIDNSETIFELDMYYKDIAKQNNSSFYKVISVPNDSDDFRDFILEYLKSV